MSEKNEYETLNKMLDILFTIILIILLISILFSVLGQTLVIITSTTEREIKLTATLTGSVLVNKPIDFYYRETGATEWIYITTVYTNSEGVAKPNSNLYQALTITLLGDSMAEERIIVREEGIDELLDSFMKILMIIIVLGIIIYLIQMIQQSLQRAVEAYVVERNVELEATLEGSVLPNKPIKFYYRESGTTEWIYIDTVYTDSEGKARKIVSLNRGTYDFKAVFEGDDDYEASSDIKHNILV